MHDKKGIFCITNIDFQTKIINFSPKNQHLGLLRNRLLAFLKKVEHKLNKVNCSLSKNRSCVTKIYLSITFDIAIMKPPKHNSQSDISKYKLNPLWITLCIPKNHYSKQ